MQQQAQHILEKILGVPLTNTTRNGLVQYFHFGSTHYTTPQGLVLDVGLYTLALDCPWQLLLSDGGIISHTEVYQQKRESGLPAPNAKFDWQVPGTSLRDQRLKELVNKNGKLVVERAEIGLRYTLTLYLTNGVVLTVTPDTSVPTELYWQLFSNSGHSVKLSTGKTGLVVA